MLHLLALLGVVGISFSAVFVRLAAVSPVTSAFYRAAYAVPVLVALRAVAHRPDERSTRARALACASGLFLALDLGLWHESIALVGVGLATVVPNVQVVVVALAATVLYGERLTARTVGMIGATLTGIVMISGLARADAFGVSPVLGILFGAGAGVSYAAYILMFRASNRSLAPTAGPLLDATVGVLVGSLLCAPFDHGFSFTPTWPSHGWLVLLAMVSQVVGWMCIATALPRLRATEGSILLLVQPVFALVWGVVFFGERLSLVQWAGAALVLASVGGLARRPVARPASEA